MAFFFSLIYLVVVLDANFVQTLLQGEYLDWGQTLEMVSQPEAEVVSLAGFQKKIAKQKMGLERT